MGADYVVPCTTIDGILTGANQTTSLLLGACNAGNIELMSNAIEWGASEASRISAAYYVIRTIEFVASRAEALILLITIGGVDVNFNPILCDNKEILQALTGREEMSECTLLMQAIRNRRVELVEVLLDHGANVNTKSEWFSDQVTPLVGAAAGSSNPTTSADEVDDCLKIVDLLLSRGASLRTVSSANATIQERGGNNALVTPAARSTTKDDHGSVTLIKLLHMGKPPAEVVEGVLEFVIPSYGRRILEEYLRGKPICCDICEITQCANGRQLKLCACRSISYCGAECQRKGWKEHKVFCGLKADGSTDALVKKREHKKKGKK
jgi:hypothetical protein